MSWQAYTTWTRELGCGCCETVHRPVYDSSGNFPKLYPNKLKALEAAEVKMKERGD